jgi:hypothetical protein
MSLANWSVILQSESKFVRRFFRSHDRVDFEIQLAIHSFRSSRS